MSGEQRKPKRRRETFWLISSLTALAVVTQVVPLDAAGRAKEIQVGMSRSEVAQIMGRAESMTTKNEIVDNKWVVDQREYYRNEGRLGKVIERVKSEFRTRRKITNLAEFPVEVCYDETDRVTAINIR